MQSGSIFTSILVWHGNSIDLAEADRLAKSREFDLYSPEMPRSTPEMNVMLQKMAKGDMRAYDRARTFTRTLPAHLAGELALFRAIFACRKTLIFPDVSMEEAETWEVPEPNPQPENIKTYDAMMASIHDVIIKNAENCTKRDRIVAARLPRFALEAAEQNPRLQRKSHINTLVTIGSRHTGLYHQLKAQGLHVTKSFNTPKPYTYAPIEQAIREHIFRDSVAADTLERAVWSQLLSNVIAPTQDNYDTYDWLAYSALLQAATRTMSEDEARELHAQFITPSKRQRFLRSAHAILNRSALPHTEIS